MDVVSATPGDAPDWSAIRQDYEVEHVSAGVICRRHGVTVSQLRYRREQEGWISSRTHVVHGSDLINRMMKILKKQLNLLENAVNEPIDKQVGALSATIKNFEKLADMSAAERNVQPTSSTNMRELRDKLAKRLDQFKQR